MNITELARRLKVTTNELREVLPEMGFDVGLRAIKVDEMIVRKIMTAWPAFNTARKKAKEQKVDEETIAENLIEKKEISLPTTITVRDFAQLLDIPVTKLLAVLMNNGILTALNEKIDYETASIIAEDMGYIPTRTDEEQAVMSAGITDIVRDTREAEKDHMVSRPPIVVVMGHVDHGKTALLDAIRSTHVIDGESGGITQHIGAYQIYKKFHGSDEKRTITFIDTPGHEAFTTMRSRGAKIADIAILVVAADDGVKLQTIEAIKIIKAAGLPLVVAINKIDKSDANMEKAKREISEHGLIPEDWGGNIMCIGVSAITNEGIDDLIERVLIIADMEKDSIVANPAGDPLAVVIESHVDQHTGPVATLLVQNGTLHTQDYLVVDDAFYGRIRAMKTYTGKEITSALPSDPVQVIGMKAAPIIGYVMQGYRELPKHIDKKLKPAGSGAVVVTPKKSKAKDHMPSVNIILKADTLGSLEAIANSLLKTDHPEVKINITVKDIGNITSSDVLNAEATGSYIAGFHVSAHPSANEMAVEKNVEIRYYKVIYELLDEVKARIEKLLAPLVTRIEVGNIKILAVFRTETHSMIVGGAITEGTFTPNIKVAVMRDDVEIGHGTITGLQLGKQDAKQAISGQECGIKYQGDPIIEAGDVLHGYREESSVRTLED
ncbi:MAG: translation initiation factor IF-2 [bacterium]|nr:translation initiation factor IF-2 [bacterium]